MRLVANINFSKKDSELYQSSSLNSQVRSHYYTTENFKRYQSEYLNREFEDLSFTVFSDEGPIVSVSVMAEVGKYSFFDFPLRPYVAEGARPVEILGAMSLVKKKIVSDCKQRGVDKVLFYENSFLNKCFQDQIQNVHLIKHYYIDLSFDDNEIKNKVRKSYKSLINWGMKNLKTVIVDKNSPSEDLFESFRQFHIEVAGRETRSKRSWEIQYEMLKEGEVSLVLCYLNESLVSGAMCMNGLEIGYYGIAINNREMMADKVALGHWPVIASAQLAKKHGLKKYTMCEINHTIYSNYINDEEKWKQIELFKAGFATSMEFINVPEVRID